MRAAFLLLISCVIGYAQIGPVNPGGGGGSATPGAPVGSVQYNNAGALGGTGTVASSLPTPAAPAVTASCPTGSCATAYTYSVVAYNSVGNSVASAVSVAVNNIAVLDGTHHNVITTPAVVGSTFCGVYAAVAGLAPSPFLPVGTVACGSAITDSVSSTISWPPAGQCCDIGSNITDYSAGISNPGVGRFDGGFISDPAGALPYTWDSQDSLGFFISKKETASSASDEVIGVLSIQADDTNNGAGWAIFEGDIFNPNSKQKQLELGWLQFAGHLRADSTYDFSNAQIGDGISGSPLQTWCSQSSTWGTSNFPYCPATAGQFDIGNLTDPNKINLVRGSAAPGDVSIQEGGGGWSLTHGGLMQLGASGATSGIAGAHIQGDGAFSVNGSAAQLWLDADDNNPYALVLTNRTAGVSHFTGMYVDTNGFFEIVADGGNANLAFNGVTGNWEITPRGSGTVEMPSVATTPATLATINASTPVDGQQAYCSDCTVTSGIDDTCAGSGSGASVVRVNGVLRCRI